MKSSNMLHQMCHDVLTNSDIKALCKARGFPRDAALSRGILETLFLSPQGLSAAFDTLDPKEIALLHLLKSLGTPVDVAFFSRICGSGRSHGTFNQRFKDCYAIVQKRLVRTGVLLLSESMQRPWEQKSKMERWRYSLPTEFHGHLPPLIPSPRQFEGDGNWRSNVVRNKLTRDIGARKKSGNEVVFRIEADELQLNGKVFSAAETASWQKAAWQEAIWDKKTKSSPKNSHSKRPDEAVLDILSELRDGYWADAEMIEAPLRVFCDNTIDTKFVCDAGWEWGLLAKRRQDGKVWYRPAPEPPHVAPDQYLASRSQGDCVAVDLSTVPLDALEQIVAVSGQRPGGTKNTLLLTPNFIKLGRADDKLLALDAVQYLVEKTQPFADAYVQLAQRRGKTILHENLHIAKVSDLSLKMMIKKALGQNLVLLKNDFIAFPLGSLNDVRRVVKKSGHVVKEVAAK